MTLQVLFSYSETWRSWKLIAPCFLVLSAPSCHGDTPDLGPSNKLHSYLFILLRNNGGFGVLATGVQQGGTVTSGTIVVGCHFRGRPGCAGELGDSLESIFSLEAP